MNSLGRLGELFLVLAVTLVIVTIIVLSLEAGSVPVSPQIDLTVLKVRQISSGGYAIDHSRALILEAPGYQRIVIDISQSGYSRPLFAGKLEGGVCIKQDYSEVDLAGQIATWKDENQRELLINRILSEYNIHVTRMERTSGQADWVLDFDPALVPTQTRLTVLFSPCSLSNAPENLTTPPEWDLPALEWPHPAIIIRSDYGQGFSTTKTMRTFNNNHPTNLGEDGVWVRSCHDQKDQVLAWDIEL